MALKYFPAVIFILYHSLVQSAPSLPSTLNIDHATLTNQAAVLTNINISTADNVRFLQLFFYDNISGSNCAGNILGIASIADNNEGLPLSVGTHQISLSGSSAYQLATATNIGINPDDVKCMRIYLSGNPQSINSTNCQDFTDESCSSITQLCTSSQSHTNSWSSSNTACRTPYVYITANSTTSALSLFKCVPNNTSLTCSSTSPTSFSRGLLGNVVNNSYGYFLSGITPQTLYQCPINPSTGDVRDSCTTITSFANNNLISGRGIAISNNYLYILDQGDTTTGTRIFACLLSNGLITGASCTVNSLTNSVTNSRGITIQNGKLYIAASSGILKCDVSSDSVSSSCELQTNATVGTPRGVTVYNNNFYYTLSTTPTGIGSCTIDPQNGTLLTCLTTGTNMVSPTAISIINGFAYILNATTSQTTICTVDTTSSPATLSSCNVYPTNINTSTGISYF